MSDKTSEKTFELIFEGIEDNSPQALQRVKGVLIGNMELSISEVQRILEHFPLTIRRADKEDELLVYFSSLKAAGAKVLILKPSSSSSASIQDNSDGIEFKIENPVSRDAILKSSDITPLNKSVKQTDSDEIEFEMDFDPITKDNSKQEKSSKAYELNLDLDGEDTLAELEKELGESLKPSPAVQTQSANYEQPKAGFAREESSSPDRKDFVLEILPAESGLDLIDTAAPSNDIHDSGEWGLDALSSSLKKAPDISSTTEAPEQEDLEEPLLQLNDYPGSASSDKTNLPPELDPSSDGASAPLFTAKELEVAQVASSPKEKSDPTPGKVDPMEEIKLGLEGAEEEKKSDTSQKTTDVKDASTLQPLASTNANSLSTSPKKDISAAESIAAAGAKFEKVAALPGKQSRLPAEILIPVLIGGVLLGIVNWLYFSSKQLPEENSTLEVNSQQLVKENDEDSDKNFKEIIKLESHTFQGESNVEERVSKILLNFDTFNIKEFSADISTPQPPALTPEEIVLQLQPRPWLRKIEAPGLLFQKQEDGSFIGRGPAKVYLETGSERNRLIANALVTLRPKDQNLLQASLEISLNTEADSAETRDFFVERDVNGNLRFLLKASIDLNLVPTPTPSAAQSEPTAGSM